MGEEKNLQNNQESGADIASLLKKNIELTESILELTKKLDSYRKWQQVFGVLKVLIILVPIIIGIIYLPAILEKVMAPYLELLGLTENIKDIDNSIENIDLKNVSPDIIKKFK